MSLSDEHFEEFTHIEQQKLNLVLNDYSSKSSCQVSHKLMILLKLFCEPIYNITPNLVVFNELP